MKQMRNGFAVLIAVVQAGGESAIKGHGNALGEPGVDAECHLRASFRSEKGQCKPVRRHWPSTR